MRKGVNKSGKSVSDACDENIVGNYQTNKNEKWAVNYFHEDAKVLSLIFFLKFIEIHFQNICVILN